MTVEEFDKATDGELRQKANDLFAEAERVKPNHEYRTALLTQARFFLDEIERRDETFRSRRDLGLELVVIGLIAIEIVFSIVAYQEGKAQFAVLSNLEASSSATAGTLAALEQTTEQMNKATQEGVALSYEVALNVRLDPADGALVITNEGRTPVTLWGTKIADDPPVMPAKPRILPPGVPQSISADRILELAQQLTTGMTVAPIPVILFAKNESGDQFVARYALVKPSGYGPFRLDTQVVSVARTPWGKRNR